MSKCFSRILLPTDFSEAGQPAAACACEMARQFQSTLHCMHVVDDGYQYWSAMGPEPVIVGPPPEELIAGARQRLDRFCADQIRNTPHPPIAFVSLGRPFAEIITYAREQNINLIVLGTHGRGAIAHALLGSTTEKVVRKAPCAVLTVRSDSHQFVAP